MTGYAEIVNKDQRLAILQALEQDHDYSHNEHVLGRVLAAVGHAVSADRMRTHLAWLAEQGLIATEDVAGVVVARLTRRGADAATGRARVPGVARPRPGE